MDGHNRRTFVATAKDGRRTRPELRFKQSGTSECSGPHGASCIPKFDVFLAGDKIDMDLNIVDSYPKLPITDIIMLEFNGKTYNLGTCGTFLVNTINLASHVHTRFTCTEFAQEFLWTKPKKATETWEFSQNSASIYPYSVVHFAGEGEVFKHAAIHIEDGIFLSKIGTSPSYAFCTLEQLQEMYGIQYVSTFQLVQRCNSCKKESPSLLLCKRCRQRTYCGRQCQSVAWKEHKLLCLPPGSRFTNLPPSQLLAVDSLDCRYLFQSCNLEKEAVAWLSEVLGTCNHNVTPCYRLEELNGLVPGQNKDDEMRELMVSNAKNSAAPLFVARLKYRIFMIVLALSRMRVIGFETCSEYESFRGPHPNIPADLKFQNKKYQAPYILRNGSTPDTGHFDSFRDHENMVYSFRWNRD